MPQIIKHLNKHGIYLSRARCTSTNFGDLTLAFRWMVYPPFHQYVIQLGPFIILYLKDKTE